MKTNKEIAADIKRFGSFNVFANALKEVDLNKVCKHLDIGQYLELHVKSRTKTKPTIVFAEKTKKGWKLNYSEYLDKNKVYSLEELSKSVKSLAK